MEINYFALFMQAFIEAVPRVAQMFVSAFQMQPWPFIAIGVIAVLSMLVPKQRRSRHRA